MLWFLIFGLAFFMAYKGKAGEDFLKKNPNNQNAIKILGVIGIYYMQAIIIMGLFPFLIKDITDNPIPVFVLIAVATLVGRVIYDEWYGRIAEANVWIKRGFFVMAIGIVIMSFTVSTEDYNKPAQETQQDLQYNGKDAQPLPDTYVSPPQ